MLKKILWLYVLVFLVGCEVPETIVVTEPDDEKGEVEVIDATQPAQEVVEEPINEECKDISGIWRTVSSTGYSEFHIKDDCSFTRPNTNPWFHTGYQSTIYIECQDRGTIILHDDMPLTENGGIQSPWVDTTLEFDGPNNGACVGYDTFQVKMRRSVNSGEKFTISIDGLYDGMTNPHILGGVYQGPVE